MQLPLLGVVDGGAPGFDAGFENVERRWLDDETWVDLVRGWVQGHAALFDTLREHVQWESHRRWMYERVVDVPRLTAGRPDGTRIDVVERLADALGRRYGTAFHSITFALYRGGRDSVAWHRDKEIRDLAEAHVALAILGEPRPFMLRPLGGGASVAYKPGWGDLLVMGGACQRTWEHCVPKVKHAGPRMSVMFREARYLAQQEEGRSSPAA
jgi:alkylated DNA repair dioxygenase AlkB